MAWWTGQPSYGSNPVSKFVRENFAWLKALIDTHDILLSGLTATPTEINTVCDGAAAKNAHTHLLADGATDITATVAQINNFCSEVIVNSTTQTTTLNMGAVSAGDRILVSFNYEGIGTGVVTDAWASLIANATNTATFRFCGATGGCTSAAAYFPPGWQVPSGANQSYINGTILVHITGAGTLKLDCYMSLSGPTGQSFQCGITGLFLKKI
jgi:hypothetical protein